MSDTGRFKGKKENLTLFKPITTLAVNQSGKQEDYAAYTTFVLAPTLPSADYENADAKVLKREFDELAGMAKKDIGYLKDSNPYPHVIYTGYAGTERTAPFSEFINGIAQCAPETEINIVFSSHGSPGSAGKLGMGSDVNNHPAYRLNVDQLVEILDRNQMGQLKNHHLHFHFRCCNSAYVRLDRFEGSEEIVKQAVKEKSLIGAFSALLREKGFINISVSGFRGYYRPGVKGAQLSDTITGKIFPIEYGTITLHPDGRVTTPEIKKLLKIQDPKLNEELLTNQADIKHSKAGKISKIPSR